MGAAASQPGTPVGRDPVGRDPAIGVASWRDDQFQGGKRARAVLQGEGHEKMSGLLSELTKEVRTVATDNQALRKENSYLRNVILRSRNSQMSMSSEGDSGGSDQPTNDLPKRRTRERKSTGMSGDEGEARMAVPSEGLAARPHAHSSNPASPRASSHGRGSGGGLMDHLPTASTLASGNIESWSEESDESNDMPAEREVLALKEQFRRVGSTAEGVVTARDLWIIVSRHEHTLYGHNKHPLRCVNKTVKLIRAVYGLAVNSSGSSLHPTLTSGKGEGSFLEFEVFLAFMCDEAHGKISDEEGGDTEYLKKALRAEDIETMAERAMKSIAEKKKEETDPRPTGWRRVILENLLPIIIFMNALVLGFQADIKSDLWEVLELIFLAFYLVELFLKLQFLGVCRYFRGSDSRWNVFDLGCILTSLIDLGFKAFQFFGQAIYGQSQLDMLKFLRMARMARIIKSFRSAYFDDLKVMSLGILSGAKVLGWAVILFFMCVYVLGVVMKETMGEQESEFGNVPSAMFSVFRCFTDGCSAYNGTPLSERLRQEYGAIFMVPYILIFLVVNFGVFNLIVAVFIDRVVTISVKSKQQDLGQRESEMRVNIEEMLVTLLKSTAATGARELRKARYRRSDQTDIFARAQIASEAMAELRSQKVTITRELFGTWLTDPDVLATLESLEIDTATKSEIFDVCDVDKSGSLTCDELVNGLMRLRGPISKCDVIAIRLKVRYLTKILEDIHHTLNA